MEFTKAIITATNQINKEPARHFPLVSKVTGHPVEQIARSWEHHSFPFGVPSDMLDIIVGEEEWVARSQQRKPRTRKELEGFIDTSIIREAMGK